MADVIDVKAINKEILTEAVNKIKPQMHDIIEASVLGFYASASPGNYARTIGLHNINKPPAESWTDNSVTLTYTFSSGDISVNSWESPWGTTYSGDPEKAFDKAYDEGYHGGPKPLHGLGNGWFWDATQQSTPIGDLIWQYIDTITI